VSILATPNYPPRLADRTVEDWRELLLTRLAAQTHGTENVRGVLDYEAFYNGEHPMLFTTYKWREAFGYLFDTFADNWCQLVVDAAVERLKIVGFEIGGSPSEAAWTLWQRSALDVESVVAHTEAGKSGRAFLLVDPNDGEPRITVEHATQVVVALDPGDRRRRLAALKHWLGDDGYQYVTLYLPELVVKWESQTTIDKLTGMTPVEWLLREGSGPNPLGVVPVIPLENKPGLMSAPHSDLEPAIPIQNAVNKLCSDMIIASEYGAFPQRAITGVDVPRDPETGQPSVDIKAALSRVWTFKAADAKLWDLKAADLSNYVNAIEMLITHLAAQTRTPPHYLLAKLVNMSGDALSVAEAGLVSKCKTKQLFFSDAWEEAVALALSASGAEVEQAECEAQWDDPERVSEGVRVDAAVKKETLGIPLPVIWRELGYTPEQVAEMEDAQPEEPPPPPPQPPPAQPPPTAPPSPLTPTI
jgi:Phage portal protein, SPP1 Gp6-like